jgi:hypothetical protein
MEKELDEHQLWLLKILICFHLQIKQLLAKMVMKQGLNYQTLVLMVHFDQLYHLMMHCQIQMAFILEFY